MDFRKQFSLKCKYILYLVLWMKCTYILDVTVVAQEIFFLIHSYSFKANLMVYVRIKIHHHT